mgnify:CR=1 FL=1
MDYKNVVVVANLPYYITTPIILKIIEESRIIKELVVMTQLEVARRLTSNPSTKDYNSLSVAIQYKTIAEIAMKVPKNVFIPAPNVDSAIVKLTIKDEIEFKPLSEVHFYNLVRSAFKQRRKTLVNNLFVRYNEEKVILISYLEDLELITTQSDFWNSSEAAEKIMKDIRVLKGWTDDYEDLQDLGDDLYVVMSNIMLSFKE